MARHDNGIILAGPVSRVQQRMFDNGGGFLEMNIAAIRVQFSLKAGDQKSLAVVSKAEAARSAILTAGYFTSRQHKTDASRWFYNIGGRLNAVTFLEQEVPILNRAQVVGEVKLVSDQWLMLGTRYLNPKKGEWRDRYVWVKCSQPMAGLEGRDLLVIGSARPKIESEWRLHIEAEGIWQL